MPYLVYSFILLVNLITVGIIYILNINFIALFRFVSHISFICFPRRIIETEFAPVAEDSYNEDDEDSCGSTVGVGGATGPTPPDSPQMGREKVRTARSISQQYPYQYTGKIVPELDIYAIPCKEGTFRFYITIAAALKIRLICS